MSYVCWDVTIYYAKEIVLIKGIIIPVFFSISLLCHKIVNMSLYQPQGIYLRNGPAKNI